MKVLAPIRELPPRDVPVVHSRDREDRRREVYLTAKRVPGEWLPVECDSWNDAAALANGARRHAIWLFDVEQRRNVTYLRFIGRRGFEPIRKPSSDIQAERTLQRIHT